MNLNGKIIHPVLGEVGVARSGRSSYAIGVGMPDLQVTVRAPLGARDSTLLTLLDRHLGWIERRRERLRLELARQPERKFIVGELFYYLGKGYPLAVDQYSIFDGRNFLVSSSTPALIQLQLRHIYRILARDYLNNRTMELADRHDLQVSTVRINSASSRWGSCSTLGNVNYPWNLVMAPPEVIDYVILHELAHTLEMNHSARFWAHVASFCPDFRYHRAHLKQHGRRYSGF